MRKNNWKSKIKKMVVTIMMTCMLFAQIGANSNAGIMPCGGVIVEEYVEAL